MTRMQAIRITGIEDLPLPQPGVTSVEDPEIGTVWLKASKPADFYRILVGEVYEARRLYAAKRQGYRCFTTGSFGNLECDHIVTRSKGRDDSLTNLRMVSPLAHGSRHTKGVTLEIHPDIREIAKGHGWEWTGELWQRI